MYRLPSDPEERQRRIKAIPRDNIPDRPNTVVCVKHFPPGFPVLKIKGESRPRDPPSVFEHILKSLIPTPPPQMRPTKKAASSSRSDLLHDELSTFLKNDSIPSFETLCAELPHRKFEFQLASFKFDSELVVQSKQFCENSGISKFSLKVKQDFTYNAYHMRVKCQISALTKNRREINIFEFL